ncbi:MAG: RsmD family RNA methyltransferase [Planctomycetaceae bacterium]|nr:RsmD family RNA methyltransferase [Planctomycetaceae bacterium]
MARQNRKSKPRDARRAPNRDSEPVVGLRIIGGKYRGRRLRYSGDVRTRPMKDRLREAVFNLVGPSIAGKHAVDLFAGTGALGLEAVSRGAARATLIEQHHPTAAIIRQNAADLGIDGQTEVAVGNTFIWFRRLPDMGPSPWAVFCSPPYDFYVERTAEMLELVNGLIAAAPAGSVFVVESDQRFDFGLLPNPSAWDVRSYPPAVVGIFRKD